MGKLQNFSRVNFLPNDKILALSKLKVFADNKINVNQKLRFNLGQAENMLEKGENSGQQHFLLLPQCFQRLFLSSSLSKWALCGKESNKPERSRPF